MKNGLKNITQKKMSKLELETKKAIDTINGDNKELMDYLRLMFTRCNHSKYVRYFDEWVSNLLPTQLKGFEDQRIRMLEKKGKYIF